jgi:hypothetical protein
MKTNEKQIIPFDIIQRKTKTAVSSTWEGKKENNFKVEYHWCPVNLKYQNMFVVIIEVKVLRL